MLTYKLDKIEGNTYFYFFYPEGSINHGGYASINFDTGEGKIIKNSPVDFGGVYSGHVLTGITKEKLEGTVAWF